MVITHSRSTEDARRAAAKRATMTDPDPRSIVPTIGGVHYASTIELDDVVPVDFKVFSGIPFFTRQALLEDVGNDYAVLERHAWNCEYFWRTTEDAVISRVWRDVLAVDAADLRSGGRSRRDASAISKIYERDLVDY